MLIAIVRACDYYMTYTDLNKKTKTCDAHFFTTINIPAN